MKILFEIIHFFEQIFCAIFCSNEQHKVILQKLRLIASMVKYLGAYFLSFVVLLMITPSSTYATHDSEEIAWQLVVISNGPACGVYHYELGQKFHVITEEYFKLYEFDANSYQPECYSNEKFDWKYVQPDDLDLLILLYDRDLGRELIHPLGIGGLYAHSGGDITHNHTIIFCDCSSFNFSETNWILTHELSHFILNYLGYDLDIIEDEIHELDSEHDDCLEGAYEESCKSINYHLDAKRLNSKINVMTPYEPAVGQKFYDSTTQLKTGTKEFELLKEITGWWIDDWITDEQYTDAMKILTGKNFHDVSPDNYLTSSQTTMLVGEPPKDKSLITENATTKAQRIMETFPFIEAWNPDAFITGDYPQWFKTRAALWSEQEITDDEFANSIEYLEKSVKGIN